MRLIALLMAGIVLLFSWGCNSDNVKGTGTVKYSSGEPVPGGMILFVASANQYSGEIVNGQFTLGGVRPGDGLPAGNYKVCITGRDAAEQPYVAVKYSSVETSGISFEVQKGVKNDFEITVEKP
ncbi:MAG: carboxypeptidase-like regulatory domain-containing protein [Planctomycetaceae bacterium]|nr:carboxypeptidase-like regulatory domain-containing protein [Planctomycetaceae bacterium]